MQVSQHDGSTAERIPWGLPPALLWAGYGLLCLVPLVLAAVQGLAARNVFREISSGLVMVGYAMALMQFLLSGRFEAISGRAGIDRTMRFHQIAGWAIFAFVLVHPFLYAVPRLWPQPADAVAAVVRMFTSQGLRSGVIAWALLLLLVPLAALRDRLPFRYEFWRLSHGLMAGAFAVLGTHHTLRVGTYSGDALLAGFWIAATALALGALLQVYVLKPLMQLRAPYRVLSNRRVAERMWEVTVAPERGPALEFAAGQFVWLNLGHSPFSLTEHPFSISSAPPARPRIAFTIKENGDFTNRIGDVAPGTRAYLDGPHGNFTLAGRRADGGVVFIAGGVGFAPVMGLLRQLAAVRFPHPLRVIYGNRAQSQILYREEIETLRQALDLEVLLVLSEPPPGWSGRTGDLSGETLNACLDASGGDDRLYFVCGPPPMMAGVKRTLRRRGVAKDRIVAEQFNYD